MPTWASGFYPARFAPGGGIFSTNLEQDARTFLFASFLGSQVGLVGALLGGFLGIGLVGLVWSGLSLLRL